MGIGPHAQLGRRWCRPITRRSRPGSPPSSSPCPPFPPSAARPPLSRLRPRPLSPPGAPGPPRPSRPLSGPLALLAAPVRPLGPARGPCPAPWPCSRPLSGPLALLAAPVRPLPLSALLPLPLSPHLPQGRGARLRPHPRIAAQDRWQAARSGRPVRHHRGRRLRRGSSSAGFSTNCRRGPGFLGRTRVGGVTLD
jgi:hypothetical protein